MIYDWLRHNQLILNWEKTHAMFFPFSIHDPTNPLTLLTNIINDFVYQEGYTNLGLSIEKNLEFRNAL